MGGETVFALRFLAVMIGVLNVPLLYQLGRMTFGKRVGLAAAFFPSLNPERDVLLFFNLLSMVGLFRFALAGDAHRRWRWLFLWALAGLAGIYTHYFAAFLFAYGVMVILWQGISSRNSAPAGRSSKIAESSPDRLKRRSLSCT